MARSDSRPRILRDKAEYDAAVSEIDGLLDTDPEPGSEAYERLEFLSVLVQAYEDVRFPLDETMEPRDDLVEDSCCNRKDSRERISPNGLVGEAAFPNSTTAGAPCPFGRSGASPKTWASLRTC